MLSKLSIVNIFRAVVLEESAAKYCFAFLIFEHGDVFWNPGRLNESNNRRLITHLTHVDFKINFILCYWLIYK